MDENRSAALPKRLAIGVWSRVLAVFHVLCFLGLWFFPMQLPWLFLALQIYQSSALRYFKPERTPADFITLIRGHMIVLAASYAVMSSGLTLGVWLVLLAGFLLDGLDGFVARKLGQQSEAGALFDMETDGVWISVLCSTLIILGIIPAWGIILAAWRPFYVFLALLLPKREEVKKGGWFEKSVYVMVSLVLIAFASPWSQDLPRETMLALACILLSVSFGKSIAGHWRKQA